MDTFLLENTIWKVILDNDITIISDNQYINGKSDWERLKDYCISNNLKIETMEIAFRDHVVQIPKGKHYFFRRMSLSRFGKVDRPEGTYQYFIVGSTNDKNKVLLKKYLVPELSIWEDENRVLEDNEESLI